MEKRMGILEKRMGIDYFQEKSLATIIGMPSYFWKDVIVKELIDNSLDELDWKNDGDKVINIIDRYDCFAINDNGRGFSEKLVEEIYDFNKYVSSKLYRRISRGMLGNALKTIIGICYVKKYQLYFVTADHKKISYVPNRERIDMGILENAFEKAIEDTDLQKGIYILSEEMITTLGSINKFLDVYRVVNPDVVFILNGEKYPPFKTGSRKLRNIHSIHWYDIQSFAELVVKYKDRYPHITPRKLVADLFNANKPLSIPNIPKFIGKLDLDGDAHVIIENLYNSLKKELKIVPPGFLNKYAIGKNMAKSIYGENFLKYACRQGTYKKKGAQIPFFIEAVLSTVEGANSIATAINNTAAYRDCPLKFKIEGLNFDKKFIKNPLLWLFYSLEELIRESGFNEGNGYKLLIQLIAPYLEFYDKSKAEINVEEMKEVIIEVIQPIVIEALRAMKKTSRSKIPEEAGVKQRKKSKISLMLDYIIEGAELATGNWQYPTTARQVFYAVRKLIINHHGISLNKGDFNKFTQDVLTKVFEERPDLEDKIFFEQRGVYIDPEAGDEMPISTRNVNNFLDRANRVTECKVLLDAGQYLPSKLKIDYPLELGTSAVLFIEKQGFKEVLERSGIAGELGLKLILSQGYSTRNIKRIIEFFLSRGVDVYLLHDYDFDGINIKHKIIEGSRTYRKALDAIDMGLSYKDIVKYNKTEDAEIYESHRAYGNIFERMGKEEQQFLWPNKQASQDKKSGKTIYTYRRVELNALTMPELLAFIRSKITNKKPKPTPEQIINSVIFDDNTINNLIKDVVTEVLLEQVPELILIYKDRIVLNNEAIIEEIIQAIQNDQLDDSWQNILRSIIRKHTEDIKNKTKGMIKIKPPSY